MGLGLLGSLRQTPCIHTQLCQPVSCVISGTRLRFRLPEFLVYKVGIMLYLSHSGDED